MPFDAQMFRNPNEHQRAMEDMSQLY